jgi:uncharacterized protein with FMN-binding domain
MRRIVIAIGTTLTGLVLLLSYSTSLNRGTFGTLPAAGGPAPQGAAPAAGAAAGTATAAKSTFDGAVSDTRYGPVQVRITVAGGKFTAADAIQLPHGNSYDEQVNQYAVPILSQEAVAAQSSKINLISGATYTSDGYMRSLQSALDQAKL